MRWKLASVVLFPYRIALRVLQRELNPILDLSVQSFQLGRVLRSALVIALIMIVPTLGFSMLAHTDTTWWNYTFKVLAWYMGLSTTLAFAAAIFIPLLLEKMGTGYGGRADRRAAAAIERKMQKHRRSK